MKQFFKFMFASMLGFLLTFVILIFVMGAIFAGIAATIGKQEKAEIDASSVLHLTFDGPVVDRSSENPFENFNFNTFETQEMIGLNDFIVNIEKARQDENIKGVFLDLSFTMSGWSSLKEIRNALQDFKESGKFVIAYSDVYGQGAYYLATVADEVYLNPEGGADFRGLNAEIMFVKNMLDKIGVEAQVIRQGEYKSAGEFLMREDMSEANREQISAYVNSAWNTILMDVSEGRNIPVNRLNEILDGYETRNANLAFEAGMIDGIVYRDEIMDILKDKLELEESDDINFVSYSKYKNVPLPESMMPVGVRDKIAIVYGSGNIVPGESTEGVMGGAGIAKAMKEARQDSSVKAIVFRVNSPGGSALASEVILREVMLASEVKPVVVSMGDVAASGGYYVSAHADKIIANPNTITGSIGVIGVIPNARELLNDKMGLTFDNVKTNEFADLMTINRPLRPVERELIREEMERIYNTFINHVAQGRAMSVERVDEIGQGRVWTGVDAQRIGLVDELGDLDYAIQEAANLAELDEYRLKELPEQKEFIEMIMEGFEGVKTSMIKSALGENYVIYKQVEDLKSPDNYGILMKLPYHITLE